MPVTEIQSEDQFAQLTQESGSKLVAIYFHTSWAAPCQQMAEVFKTLSDAHPDVTFIAVNADDHVEVSELFDVSAVPYFVFVKNSTILKEFSGADPKKLVDAVNEFSSSKSTSETTAQNAKTTSASPTAGADAASGEEESEDALNARLAKLVKAAPIMLFMKGSPSSPQCGFSRQLVAILREHQVKFGFFDILKDDAVRQGLKKFSDWPTFPQLYINGELQGGLDIIKESIEEDPKFFENALSA